MIQCFGSQSSSLKPQIPATFRVEHLSNATGESALNSPCPIGFSFFWHSIEFYLPKLDPVKNEHSLENLPVNAYHDPSPPVSKFLKERLCRFWKGNPKLFENTATATAAFFLYLASGLS